jgi:hypothetical protein
LHWDIVGVDDARVWAYDRRVDTNVVLSAGCRSLPKCFGIGHKGREVLARVLEELLGGRVVLVRAVLTRLESSQDLGLSVGRILSSDKISVSTR